MWAEPGHTCVHPEEESAALSQDAHKLQEVLVTQETQAASFSKHRWLKSKSEFPIHWGNSPLSTYSSTGDRARCLLSIQGMLEFLLPVSQDLMPMSASYQGPEVVFLVLQLCLPPQVSRPTPPGAMPSLLVRQHQDIPSPQIFLLQLALLHQHTGPTFSWVTYWGTSL